MLTNYRLGKSEILQGVNDYVRAWLSDTNTVTRVTVSGAYVVRYRDSDVLWVAPSRRAFRVDAGAHSPAIVASRVNRGLYAALAQDLPRVRVLPAAPMVLVLNGRDGDTAPIARFATSIEAVHNGRGWHCWPDVAPDWRPYANPSPGGPAL